VSLLSPLSDCRAWSNSETPRTQPVRPPFLYLVVPQSRYADDLRTDDDIPLGYWSTIEMSFAIVVSCMPGIRLFVLHFFPRLDSVQGSSGVNPSASARSNNAAHRGRFSSSRKKNSQTMDTEYILDNNSTYELLEVDGPLPKAFNPRPSRI
jgi:hypothetical protein